MPLIEPYWVPVVNSDTQAVPPFGVMAPDLGGINSDGQLSIARPSAAGLTNVFFNGPSPIAPGRSGQGHQTFPAIAAYSQYTTPAKGDQWGTQMNSWYLAKGSPGFTILDAAGGLANVTQDVAGLLGNTGLFDVNCYYNNVLTPPFWDANATFMGPGSPSGNWPVACTPLANTIYTLPIGPFPQGLNLSAVGVALNTLGGTGSKCRIAVWKNPGILSVSPTGGGATSPPGTHSGSGSVSDNSPDTLWYDSGDIMLDGTGAPALSWAEIAGNPGIGLWLSYLPPNLYWVSVQFNSASPMPAVMGCSTDHMRAQPFIGLSENSFLSYPQVIFGALTPKPYAAFSSASLYYPPTSSGPLEGSQIVPMACLSGWV